MRRTFILTTLIPLHFPILFYFFKKKIQRFLIIYVISKKPPRICYIIIPPHPLPSHQQLHTFQHKRREIARLLNMRACPRNCTAVCSIYAICFSDHSHCLCLRADEVAFSSDYGFCLLSDRSDNIFYSFFFWGLGC